MLMRVQPSAKPKNDRDPQEHLEFMTKPWQDLVSATPLLQDAASLFAGLIWLCPFLTQCLTACHGMSHQDTFGALATTGTELGWQLGGTTYYETHHATPRYGDGRFETWPESHEIEFEARQLELSSLLVGYSYHFIPLSTWLFCPFANKRCESSSSKI